MFKLFKSDRLSKAYKAITVDDLTGLHKHLSKLENNEINLPVAEGLPTLIEAAITAHSPKAIKLMVDFGADIQGQSNQQPKYTLFELALQQPNSHALLGALLTAHEKPDLQPLLITCFEQCNETTLMMHLSLFVQHGAKLTDEHILMSLSANRPELVHFVINSGATKPDIFDISPYDPAIVAYANKCWDDIKIREMMMS